ncbi:hypothetical protein CR51_42580 [Caballeronia megalochromosomata]|nr:hypothetical protein CR51_42580 [Caballeronia megalochromosomata]
MGFDQAAAAAAQVHPINAAETEGAVLQDEDFAVHDASCLAGSLDESCRSWSQQVAATVESKTAQGARLFRAKTAIYLCEAGE